jgi:hypothetical protein
MADTKISALTAVTSPTTALEIPVNESGTTKKLTVLKLLGGFAGGKAYTGGTGAGDNADYHSTSHSTKGKHRFGGASGSLVIDEANGRIGIGTLSPESQLHIEGGLPDIQFENTDAAADEGVWRQTVQDDGSFKIAPYTDAGVAGSTLFDALRVTGDNEIDAIRMGDSAGSWTIKADVTNRRVYLGLPTSAPADGTLQNNQVVFWNSSGNLGIKLKDNAGAVTTGSVTLS